MKKVTGIYLIQSFIKPDRFYIGSAISIQNRWNTHLSSLKNGKHYSKKMQRHVDKYSLADLEFKIIIECDKSVLLLTEQRFLDLIHPYFNTSVIAGSPMKGLKHSRKSKNKMRDVKIGMKYKPMSEQGKKNLGKCMLGKKHSEETKAKMSIAHKGKRLGIPTWNKGGTMSDEWKAKISKAHKGKPKKRKAV